jgi:hypothetical protein
MGRAPQGKDGVCAPGEGLSGRNAGGIRPSEAQRRYLERGLTQPGGKLPLFDREGREVSKKTVESCVAHGWATPLDAQPYQAGLAGLPPHPGRLSSARRQAAFRASHAERRTADIGYLDST